MGDLCAGVLEIGRVFRFWGNGWRCCSLFQALLLLVLSLGLLQSSVVVQWRCSSQWLASIRFDSNLLKELQALLEKDAFGLEGGDLLLCAGQVGFDLFQLLLSHFQLEALPRQLLVQVLRVYVGRLGLCGGGWGRFLELLLHFSQPHASVVQLDRLLHQLALELAQFLFQFAVAVLVLFQLGFDAFQVQSATFQLNFQLAELFLAWS